MSWKIATIVILMTALGALQLLIARAESPWGTHYVWLSLCVPAVLAIPSAFFPSERRVWNFVGMAFVLVWAYSILVGFLWVVCDPNMGPAVFEIGFIPVLPMLLLFSRYSLLLCLGVALVGTGIGGLLRGRSGLYRALLFVAIIGMCALSGFLTATIAQQHGAHPKSGNCVF